MGLFQRLFGKRQMPETITSDLPTGKQNSNQMESKTELEKKETPLTAFNPVVQARRQEQNRGLNYGNAGVESYRLLANALKTIPSLSLKDSRLPEKTWPFSFEKMIDEIDFHLGQSAAQGSVIPVIIRHGIFVYVNNQYEIAKVNDDSYLLWDDPHDPKGSSENDTSQSAKNPLEANSTSSTIRIGKLEVMRKDLGEMSWKDAKKACESLGPGWHLPTKDELDVLYINKDLIGGFMVKKYDDYYWSSSGYSSISAWVQCFSDGTQDSSGYESSPMYVRAVRTL